MSNRSGPLIAHFSGKTVMLQVSDILKKAEDKMASSFTNQSSATSSIDPWRILYETTMESIIAASGYPKKPIDSSLLDLLCDEPFTTSPTFPPASCPSLPCSSVDDPTTEKAVRAVIRRLQKEPKFHSYFVNLAD